MPSAEEKKKSIGTRLCWLLLGALGIAVCLIGSAWLGHEEIGLPAFMFGFSLVSGVQMEWKWRGKAWFWGMVAFVALADIALLFWVSWPHAVGNGRGKLEGFLVAVGNIVMFGALFWITRRICEGRPIPEPVLCRACQHEVEKNALRCPHCGEWKPGPLPVWPLLVVFGPLAIMMAGMAFTIDWNAPSEQPKAPAMEDYALGLPVTDAMHRSVVRTLLRAEDLPCGTLKSVTSRGGAVWLAQCEQHGEQHSYVVNAKSGAVRACPNVMGSACE